MTFNPGTNNRIENETKQSINKRANDVVQNINTFTLLGIFWLSSITILIANPAILFRTGNINLIFLIHKANINNDPEHEQQRDYSSNQDSPWD